MSPMLLPVQPYTETQPGNCGPAALKMVLAYYGIDQAEATLARQLNTTPAAGTTDAALQRVAQQYGLRVTVKAPSTFDDLAQWLRQQVPVIVDWFSSATSEEETGDGHYSVVVGLDSGHIYLQDPELGRLRRLTRPDFLRVWFDFPHNFIRSPDELILRELIAIHRPPKKSLGKKTYSHKNTLPLPAR